MSTVFMKTKALIFIALAQLLVSCSSGTPGNGVVKTVKAKIKKFDRLEVISDVDVTVQLGSSHGAVIKGETNLIPYITIKNNGDTLIVSTKRGSRLAPTVPLVVTVTLPQLDHFKKQGPSTVNIQNINQPQLKVVSEGSGFLSMKGTASKLFLTRVGSGHVNATRLSGYLAEIKNYGSGNVSIGSYNRLKPIIDGSGNIECSKVSRIFGQKYKGSGKLIRTY